MKYSIISLLKTVGAILANPHNPHSTTADVLLEVRLPQNISVRFPPEFDSSWPNCPARSLQNQKPFIAPHVTLRGICLEDLCDIR